jgi:hypothetical protein
LHEASAFTSAYRPASHTAQAVKFAPVEFAYWPSTHELQDVSPAFGWYLPCGQRSHSVIPGTLAKRPAVHSVHVVSPPSSSEYAYWPSAHELQEVALAEVQLVSLAFRWYWPCGQGSHTQMVAYRRRRRMPVQQNLPAVHAAVSRRCSCNPSAASTTCAKSSASRPTVDRRPKGQPRNEELLVGGECGLCASRARCASSG